VSGQSAIEWTQGTWNPVTGCSKVSPGCAHCYWETFAERFRGVKGHQFEQGFDLRLWPERLELPLRWRKPKLIFVNSMSDLFHPDILEWFLARVWGTMARARWHTFQVLTKRPERMPKLLRRLRLQDPPLPNVSIGTSIENRRFTHRADHLRRTPAVVRFISAEPLLGPLDGVDLTGIDWLIAGGESGPRHRPINPEWVRELRDRCQTEQVAFFFKQWGGVRPSSGGRELDGRTLDQMPSVVPDPAGDRPEEAILPAGEHTPAGAGAGSRPPTVPKPAPRVLASRSNASGETSAAESAAGTRARTTGRALA
jgi:protein gp37